MSFSCLFINEVAPGSSFKAIVGSYETLVLRDLPEHNYQTVNTLSERVSNLPNVRKKVGNPATEKSRVLQVCLPD